jgi:hypothetical protein
MPKASPIQTAFNSGEWSKLLQGQTTIKGRPYALELMQNMIALKQGPATRRGGTKFIKEVKDSSKRTALIDFQYDESQVYQIEVGDQYFRFYRNNAVITATSQNITAITKANPAVVTYSGADTFANGDEIYIDAIVGMTQLNGKFFKVANVNTGTNTLELTNIYGTNINSTNYTAYVSGGTLAEVYTVSSPYTQADLYDSKNIFQLQFAQVADVIYITHGSYKPRSLTRSGHASWALAALITEDGPYLDTNTTTTTLTLSSTTGSVTVTASSVTGINTNAGFKTTDIGRIIRFKDPAGNWTWLTITAWTSTTVVTATISGADASAGTATVTWRLGVWSDTTGWPKCCTFFQDRFSVGNSTTYPDRYDLSVTSGYSNTTVSFPPTNAAGTVLDNSAISGNLPSLRVNAIQWMAADNTGLVCGTTGQEWVIKSNAANEVLTAANRKADPVSNTKSAFIQPVIAGSNLMFVQKARRRFYDMTYSFQLDRLKPNDLNLYAEHITRTQVLGMVYQQQPIDVVWSYRNDGLLLGMTYYPDQEVNAWHRHPIGGYSNSAKTIGAIVESISVTPSADGTYDELWMIVNRYINGRTRRYIEYMTHYYEDDVDLEDAFQVDCGLTYDGVATSVITGLDHLEGETVKVMRDGKSHPDLVVTNGAITLANNLTGSKVHVGYKNPWAIKTMEIEAGAADGTAQGKIKRITNFVLKLLNALGLSYGPDADTLDTDTFNQGAAYDESIALFSGNTDPLLWPNGYDQSGQMYFTDDGVFPMTITAICPQLNTMD